ncbi:MAG: cupin domain-containing protein [Candidatus Thorarchaeota archaeon]
MSVDIHGKQLPTKAIGHRRNFIFDDLIVVLIIMVKIFKASDSEAIHKKGYTAKYVADVEFRKNLKSGGFIFVTVNAGTKSEPHAHGELEEIFVLLSDMKMKIDSVDYELEKGDVVLVGPNETHSFEAVADSPASMIAIKFPNLKNDRVSSKNQ